MLGYYLANAASVIPDSMVQIPRVRQLCDSELLLKHIPAATNGIMESIIAVLRWKDSRLAKK